MKHAFHAALVAALLAGPVSAQVEEAPAEDEGFSLMQEGAELFFRGIMGEMEPAIEDFRAFAEMAEPHLRSLLSEMGPALMQVLDRIDDIANYEAPEILENGDIIIRRKREAPEFTPDPDAPEIEI
ncbi:hypothetical protein [Limimaricola sp. AA108-03]|uniref:hypothetical protein n=1 Tax=Limimaricola sp. AA108-03 TaxID=3425945 RepID=UPI003D76DF5D